MFFWYSFNGPFEERRRELPKGPLADLPEVQVSNQIWRENCLASLRALDGLVSLFVESNSLSRIERDSTGGQTKQAEIVPFALDQVNTCVGNVLPLPGTFVSKMIFFGTLVSYPLTCFAMLISTSLWIIDSFVVPRDCNHCRCSGSHHLRGMLCLASYGIRLSGPDYSKEIARRLYFDHVGK